MSNDLEKVIGVEIYDKSKKVWNKRMMPLESALALVYEESHVLYGAYKAPGANKSSRVKARDNHDKNVGMNIRVSVSALKLLASYVKDKKPLGEYDAEYLRWMFLYLKKASGKYDMPMFGKKNEKYSVMRDLDGALYQQVNSQLSKSACLSVSESALYNDRYVLLINDLECETFEDYVKYFKECRGYEKYESAFYNNADRKKCQVGFKIDKSADGLRYLSKGYFA